MNTTRAADAFLASRDFLLKHRTDYDTAVRGFDWPAQEHFNWALDYFDAIATGNDRPALHIVEEDGTETIRSFAELSAASNRVANFLRSLRRTTRRLPVADARQRSGALGNAARRDQAWRRRDARDDAAHHR